MTWVKGQSGNPSGAAAGPRARLNRAFLRDLERAWARRGQAALDELADNDPATLVRVCASLLPKDVKLTTDVGESFLQLLAHLDTKRLPALDLTAESVPVIGAKALEMAAAEAPEVLESHTSSPQKTAIPEQVAVLPGGDTS